MSDVLLFPEHGENMLCTKIVLNVRNNSVHNMVSPCSELGILMYWTCNSTNNLSSYCELVDAKTWASDKDLPVSNMYRILEFSCLTQNQWFNEIIHFQERQDLPQKLTTFLLWFSPFAFSYKKTISSFIFDWSPLSAKMLLNLIYWFVYQFEIWQKLEFNLIYPKELSWTENCNMFP